MITVEHALAVEPSHRRCACDALRTGGLRCTAGEGRKEVTLTPGQTFYEGPDEIMALTGTQAKPSRRNSWCS
jgi:hypothetical protein